MQFMNLGAGKIEALCAQDRGSQFDLTHVWYDVERGRLASTNGCAVVVCHVIPDEGETTGYISKGALEAYRRMVLQVPYGPAVVRLTAKEDVTVTNGVQTSTFQRPKGEKGFPNFEGLFPGLADPRAPDICVDIDLLKTVADALGHLQTHTGKSRMVAVWLNRREDGSICREGAVLVKTSEHGALGLIAPMRSDEKGWLTSLSQIEQRIEDAKAAKPATVHQFPDAVDDEESDEDEEEVSADGGSATAISA